MATTTQLRTWWSAYKCKPLKMVPVAFPIYPGGSISLKVAGPAKPIWEAYAQIMATEAYYFEEIEGGTYNCRNIKGTNQPSLHGYGLALDINPSVNPWQKPLTHNYPQDFIDRVLGITANGKQAITWGGTFATPDAMHWQINVAPTDCKNIQWDKGVIDMPWTKPGDVVENITDADRVFEYQGSFAPGVKQASYQPTTDAEANDRVWVVMARITDWCMRNAK